jgi:hypothetical protein
LQVNSDAMLSRRRHSVAVALTLPARSSYSEAEEIAFRHARKYLGAHEMFVVLPASQHVSYRGFRPMPFPDRYFGSAKAHGTLLLSERFYEAFADFDFVLIHHLDALALRDNLDDWCDAGYDYIGAPWLVCGDTPHITAEKVGNGGFSLRRVASFLRVLQSRRYFVDPEEYWRQYAARTSPLVRWLNSPRRVLKRVHALNDVRWHIRWALRGGVHEDRFWAEYATHYDPAFRIASVDVAMRFAFEAEPRRCYERIGRQLPLGAHRWQTFDPAFFEPYLLRTGLGSGVSADLAERSPVSTPSLEIAHQ